MWAISRPAAPCRLNCGSIQMPSRKGTGLLFAAICVFAYGKLGKARGLARGGFGDEAPGLRIAQLFANVRGGHSRGQLGHSTARISAQTARSASVISLSENSMADAPVYGCLPSRSNRRYGGALNQVLMASTDAKRSSGGIARSGTMKPTSGPYQRTTAPLEMVTSSTASQAACHLLLRLEKAKPSLAICRWAVSLSLGNLQAEIRRVQIATSQR